MVAWNRYVLSRCLIPVCLVLLAVLLSFGGCSKKDKKPLNVLLIVVDALRADHLGAYGYSRDTSPFFDRWCQGGVLFENVISQSSWTKTSMASMLSGLEPETLRVYFYEDTLPEEAVTLAEILNRQGYQTAYVQTNPWLLDRFGFDQGFEELAQLRPQTEIWPEKKVAYRAFTVNEQARIWLEGRDKERPFFLYLHYMDVHGPYLPPPPHNRIFDPDFPREIRDYILCIKFLYEEVEFSSTSMQVFERLKQDEDLLGHVISLYDGEIHYFDQEFENLMTYLDKSGTLENTLVVFASDHGEQFMEHGKLRHANSLYIEELEVPLVFFLPGMTGENKRIAHTVRNIDILPTILDVLGIEHDYTLEGISLLPLIKGRAGEWQGAPAFSGLKVKSETPDEFMVTRDELDYAAIRYGEWVLIQDHSKGWLELYNLSQDPDEKNDLADKRQDMLKKLNPLLDEYLESSARLRGNLGIPEGPVSTMIDEDMRKRLEAVGYFAK